MLLPFSHSQLPFVPLSQSAPSHRFTPPEIHHSLTHNTHTATSHNTPPDQTSKVPAFLISKTSHPKTNPKAITNSHTPRHNFGSSSHMHVFFLLYSVTLPMGLTLRSLQFQTPLHPHILLSCIGTRSPINNQSVLCSLDRKRF